MAKQVIARMRASLRWLALAGLLLVVASGLMQRWAQAQGVHCPECDRPADMAFWTTYFQIKLTVLGLGALSGLLAAVGASGGVSRLGGAAAVIIAFLVFVTTPK